MTATAPEPLDGLADQLGALAWISDALFGLQGAWAADMADPAAVEHLATASRHHGWHVEMLVDLLPDSLALAGAERVTAPPGWAAAVVIGGEATGDPARLAVLYRVMVPRLAGEIAVARRAAVGPGDGAIARALGFVATDVADDLAAGSGLLGAALDGDGAVRIAHEATVRLDLAFANR